MLKCGRKACFRIKIPYIRCSWSPANPQICLDLSRINHCSRTEETELQCPSSQLTKPNSEPDTHVLLPSIDGPCPEALPAEGRLSTQGRPSTRARSAPSHVAPPSRCQLPRKHKPHVRAGGCHSPFCPSVLLWIKIVCDFPKLGEDLMDDVFEFLQAVGPHLRHVVDHNHRVDPVCFLRPVFEHVPQQLCRRGRCAEWFSLTKLMHQVSTLNKSPKSKKCIINLNAFALNIKILQPWLD